MSRRRHAIHLRLAAGALCLPPLRRPGVAVAVSRRSQEQIDSVGGRGRGSRLCNHRARHAPMHHGPMLGAGVLEIASAHANHGRRRRFRRGASRRALAVRIPSSGTRSRRARARQHRPHGIRCIAGARSERLLVLVEHNLRRGHGIRLLPQPRVSAKCGFACRLIHLRLGRDHVRRSIAAQSHAARGCSARGSAAGGISTRPCRLHIPVRKEVVRLPRYIHLVRGQLETAIDDPRPVPGARTARQVQPLARALVHRFSCRCAQGRLRLCARLCRRLLEEDHMPNQFSRLHIRSAGRLCPTAVSLLACFLFAEPCSMFHVLRRILRRKTHIQTIAAGRLLGSCRRGLFHLRVPGAHQRAQCRSRAKRARHFIGGHFRGYRCGITAPAFTGNHHSARTVNRLRFQLRLACARAPVLSPVSNRPEVYIRHR